MTNNFFSTVVLSSFRNKIRKILNFSEYISNNSNCCKLCSEQTIIYFYLFIFFNIKYHSIIMIYFLLYFIEGVDFIANTHFQHFFLIVQSIYCPHQSLWAKLNTLTLKQRFLSYLNLHLDGAIHLLKNWHPGLSYSNNGYHFPLDKSLSSAQRNWSP